MSDTAVTVGTSPQPTAGPSNKELAEKLQVAAVVSQKEESDVAKDEKRDSEKPLLKDDSVKLQIDDSKPDGNDAATLPLPERVSKSRAKDAPPSMFLFPVARIRHAWHNSSNLIEFLTRTTCIIFANLGWMVLVGGVPFLSVVQLVIGSIYINDCPAEPKIPEYLIVSGFFGTILHGVAVCTKYAPKDKKALFEAQRRRCLCVEAILQIFLLIWFIAGCFWVYMIFEPEYKIKAHADYCHKTLYLFTFWMFNVTFIILILIITFAICCVSFIAIGSKKSPE